ncbi:MAG: 50S ribosomal protein L18Ae [Candidatus Thorarchaeota archaeon]
MSSKVWRATGAYLKNKRKYRFSRELMGLKEAHVREKVLSEIGSRHRVRRKDISFTQVKEIKPEEATNLELRRMLGLESEL